MRDLCTDSSSTDAASMRPVHSLFAAEREVLPIEHTIYPGYLRGFDHLARSDVLAACENFRLGNMYGELRRRGEGSAEIRSKARYRSLNRWRIPQAVASSGASAKFRRGDAGRRPRRPRAGSI